MPVTSLFDFFAPHTFFNLAFFVLIIASFEIIGSTLASFLKFPSFLRASHWILGLGAFVTIWFGLHFWLPFWPSYVAVTLTLLTLGAFPYYFSRRLWTTILPLTPMIIVTGLVLIPFLKPLYYHTALPPRIWDEMAYHFYSPARLASETTWNFASDHEKGFSFYMMMPRWLDTSFILVFALSQTYATAQLLHVAIVLTAMLVGATFIKEKIGLLSSFSFIFLFITLNTELFRAASTGYVDAGAGALLFMAFLATIHAGFKPTRHHWYAAAILSGLSLGIKYTNVVLLISVWLVSIMMTWFSARPLILNFLKKPAIKKLLLNIVVLALLGMASGGYWYVKNAVISGNPVYPFIFGCGGCMEEHALDNWGYLTLSPENQETIIKTVFFGEPKLYTLVLISFALTLWSSIYTKHRSKLWLAVTLLLTLCFEVLIHNRVSLFAMRFFYHWVFIIPLALSLLVTWPKKIYSPRYPILFAVYLLFASLVILVSKPLILDQRKIFTNIQQIHPASQAFALKKISILEWVTMAFPHTETVVDWCGQSGREVVNLHTFDPEIIWNYYGLSKIFFAHCTLKISIPGPIEAAPQSAESFIENHQGEYIWSITNCIQPLPQYPEKIKNEYATLNQAIICRSEVVAPNLYRIGK